MKQDWFTLNNFNYDKFMAERMGTGRGKMQWRNWQEVAWYYGLGTVVNCNETLLKKGNITRTLYDSLCRTFGREAMDEYFKPEDAQVQKPQATAKPDFTKREYSDTEIEALAAIM